MSDSAADELHLGDRDHVARVFATGRIGGEDLHRDARRRDVDRQSSASSASRRDPASRWSVVERPANLTHAVVLGEAVDAGQRVDLDVAADQADRRELRRPVERERQRLSARRRLAPPGRRRVAVEHVARREHDRRAVRLLRVRRLARRRRLAGRRSPGRRGERRRRPCRLRRWRGGRGRSPDRGGRGRQAARPSRPAARSAAVPASAWPAAASRPAARRVAARDDQRALVEPVGEPAAPAIGR